MDNLLDYIKRVEDLVKDDSNIVSPGGVTGIIDTAVQRFSRQRPRTLVSDIAGDGSYDYDLPSGWLDGFSRILVVEYPSGRRDPEILEEDRYDVYRSPTGLKLRFFENTPLASETIRLTFTVPHTLGDSSTTVPTTDEAAVCFLAASLTATVISSHYAQQRDPTIRGSNINATDRSLRYQKLAKEYLGMYLAHLGIKSEIDLPAAGGVADWDRNLSTGHDRLTHPRRRR